jgi:hypothetical protein
VARRRASPRGDRSRSWVTSRRKRRASSRETPRARATSITSRVNQVPVSTSLAEPHSAQRHSRPPPRSGGGGTVNAYE